MAFQVKYKSGQTATFKTRPTDADIDEVAKRLNVSTSQQGLTQPSGSSLPATPEKLGSTGVKGLGVGIVKRGLETAQGLGQLALRGAEVVTGREKGKFGSQERFFQDPTALEAKTGAEKVGKFVTGVAEFAVPGTKVARATQGLGLLPRLGSRAGTTGAVATAQEGEIGKGTAIAGGIELAIPGAGAVIKPVFNIAKRLFKGLGSALSGVGTETIETIVRNPQKAAQVTKELQKSGGFKVLEDNARTIVNGVSRVRQEARKGFGEALETLSKTDINLPNVKNAAIQALKENGIVVSKTGFNLKNAEFAAPLIVKKAKGIINEINNLKSLDGKSLQRILAKIESIKFKSPGSDPERLAFNALMKDLDKRLTTAVSKSTPKLQQANKAFSKDMQLVEEIESILGKIKFRSLKEVNNVAKKLENLFSQTGLSPREVDTFLRRIGISPEDFRTSEAVRQIVSKTTGANTKGVSFAEILQQITSSIITPETVKNISIITGLSTQVLKPLLESVAPSARGTLIQLIIDNKN